MASAYLVDATRTPFGRFGGALASVRTDDLAALPIAALMARHPALTWAALDEVILACANQAGEDNRIDSMAQTAENLAREPGIDRDSQDAYALRSQQRAANAQRQGWLAEESTAVQVSRGNEAGVERVDEHPRPATTAAQLAALQPLLGAGTSITASGARLAMTAAFALRRHRQGRAGQPVRRRRPGRGSFDGATMNRTGLPSYAFACDVADDRAHGHAARALTKAYYQPLGFSYSLAEASSRVATADATRHVPVVPPDPPVFTGALPCAAAAGET